MDIRKLDAFCRIVELKSFTKAAQAMQLSQPTVSDHIRHLEEELGQKLVDRRGREAEPTPVGRLLYSYASKILRLQQETLQALVQYSGQFVGNLLIGASTIPGTFILPPIISRFRQQYPDIKTIVRISGSRTVAQKVLDGEYDLGLVGAMWNERGLEWQPLFTDTLVLVTYPGGFAHNRQAIPVSGILAEPFVFREQGSGTRKSIGQILENKGYREADLHEAAQFGSNEAVKEAVKAGVGISMLSRRSIAGELERGTLIAIPLDDVSGERPFYLVTRKNKALAPIATAFAEHLRGEADQGDASSR
ncbi:MAG: LysR family transcriptional regulator [Desulfobulbus sp.]|jgi:DNA-binding transcriptional LysR family regulator|uniref:selenium metabolism-associated LysR family transcriptional regulator n=1 Tax=Desulfobulbus sp. TaxID=895 RepID=UPI0028495F0A|nr:selenium metabolism-associated LysR family transcriptional regulator [Desulfobulbus sp.]MDR2549965.1 LysR family transcriptional regulator [Desulfobulbus sp.]